MLLFKREGWKCFGWVIKESSIPNYASDASAKAMKYRNKKIYTVLISLLKCEKYFNKKSNFKIWWEKCLENMCKVENDDTHNSHLPQKT